MPAKKADEKIWNQVNNVDLWGPATINNKNGKTYMHLMTMIDPVSCSFEVAAIRDDPKSLECQRILDSQWLSMYPRPKEVGCDGGSKSNKYFNDLCVKISTCRNARVGLGIPGRMLYWNAFTKF